MDIKSNLKGRIFSMAVAVCGIITLILYLTSGLSIYNDQYSALLITVLVLGTLLGATAAVLPIRACMFGAYLCFIVALIEFIVTQINYLAAVIYPMLVGTLVDDVAIEATFVLTVIFCLAAFVLALVGGILTKKDFIHEKVFKDVTEVKE